MSEKVTDEMKGMKFKSMLRTFETLIDGEPPALKIKQDLLDLASESTSSQMTPRQVEAVHGRCMEYINGTYGSRARFL